MRVLLVEDDPSAGTLAVAALRADGHAVDWATNAQDALWHARESPYQVVVADTGLPDASGVHVVRQLRDAGVWAPVLVVSAASDVVHRVAGLDAGADDYLPKPYDPSELQARVRALARRALPERPAELEVDDLVLDPARRRVEREGREVPLTPQEFALLHALLRADGAVVPRSALRDQLWDFASDVGENALDVLVSGLRAKVDRPFSTPLVHTVRGTGYRVALEP